MCHKPVVQCVFNRLKRLFFFLFHMTGYCEPDSWGKMIKERYEGIRNGEEPGKHAGFRL